MNKVEVPVFTEDFEEITQTVENGVVVEESRRTVKSPITKNKQPSPHPDLTFALEVMDINENFETKDMDEEGKGVSSRVQTHYLKTRNKNEMFVNQNPSMNSSKKGNLQPPQNITGGTDPTNMHVAGPDSVDLLEESQEVVMFQSDSKNTSPNISYHHRKESNSSSQKLENSKFAPKEEGKYTPDKLIIPTTSLAKNFERDSPGPKRDTITTSIEK